MRGVLSILIIAATAIAACSQTLDETRAKIKAESSPAKRLEIISAHRTNVFAEARKTSAPIDSRKLASELEQLAKLAVEGATTTKVEDDYDWARLFQMAGMDKQACEAAERYVKFEKDPLKKYNAQSLMMQSCNKLGEADMLIMMLASVDPPSLPLKASLVSQTAYGYFDTIAKAKGVDAAIKVLSNMEKSVSDFSKAVDDKEKSQMIGAFVAIASTKAEALGGAHRTKEAIEVLTIAIAKLPEGDRGIRSLSMAKKQLEIVGLPNPGLAFEKSYGDFKGLDALKGKVVLVDFFAHWCGPCKAAFPDMIQLYKDFKDKGLEIVGVTTYYGYYGKDNVKDRDMPKETEFAKMADFIKEFSLPWSVAYVERSQFENYGVSGIPTVAVIDRKGVLHKLKVGYSKDSFAEFRKEIEKLLGN